VKCDWPNLNPLNIREYSRVISGILFNRNFISVEKSIFKTPNSPPSIALFEAFQACLLFYIDCFICAVENLNIPPSRRHPRSTPSTQSPKKSQENERQTYENSDPESSKQPAQKLLLRFKKPGDLVVPETQFTTDDVLEDRNQLETQVSFLLTLKWGFGLIVHIAQDFPL
jgi:hypothetical protein